MRVARFQSEANLKELVGRLYKLGPKGPTAAAAGTGLAEANRHLPLRSKSLASAIPEGTLLAVPELDGAAHIGPSPSVPGMAAQVLRARATVLLERIAADLEASSARDADELATMSTLLGTEEWQAAAETDDTVAAAVKQVAVSVDERRARVEAVDQEHRRILEEARRAVEQLAGLAGPPD